jgi:hypothetical protein
MEGPTANHIYEGDCVEKRTDPLRVETLSFKSQDVEVS